MQRRRRQMINKTQQKSRVWQPGGLHRTAVSAASKRYDDFGFGFD